MTLSLILLTLLSAADPKDDDPTQGSRIALDFRNATIAQVVQGLAKTGNAIDYQNGFNNGFDQDVGPRRVTLESKEPVLFWEALDRLCRENSLRADLTNRGGPFSRPQLQIVNVPSGDDSVTQYVGPLRMSQLRIHSHHEIRYGPDQIDSSANGPLYAEFRLQVEPRVLIGTVASPGDVHVIDELNQSLAKKEEPRARAQSVSNIGSALTISMPLARPAKESHWIKTLSGVIPIELAVMPKEPAKSVPLDQAEGNTYRVGDVIVEVQESRSLPNNVFRLRLSAKVDATKTNDRGPSLARQIEVVDAGGNAVNGSGSVSHGSVMMLDMTYFGQQQGNPPKSLYIFAPKYVRWNAPFAFTNIPLP